MARIYTKRGDSGITSIHGGDKVAKDSARIEANGTLDELNSLIGVIRACIRNGGDCIFNSGNGIRNGEYCMLKEGVENQKKEETYDSLEELLADIQKTMMPLMSIVATPSCKRDANPQKFDAAMINVCENVIDTVAEKLEGRNFFVCPGGTMTASLLQLARSVARRAERRLWTLNREDSLEPEIMQFINRLSDLFFVLARYENLKMNVGEERWVEFHYYKRRK